MPLRKMRIVASERSFCNRLVTSRFAESLCCHVVCPSVASCLVLSRTLSRPAGPAQCHTSSCHVVLFPHVAPCLLRSCSLWSHAECSAPCLFLVFSFYSLFPASGEWGAASRKSSHKKARARRPNVEEMAINRRSAGCFPSAVRAPLSQPGPQTPRDHREPTPTSATSKAVSCTTTVASRGQRGGSLSVLRRPHAFITCKHGSSTRMVSTSSQQIHGPIKA